MISQLSFTTDGKLDKVAKGWDKSLQTDPNGSNVSPYLPKKNRLKPKAKNEQ